MSSSSLPEIHITSSTLLLPALRGWEVYLKDQGRSPYTIKAFLGDLQLLASYLPPDRTIGSNTTREINQFLAWLQSGRGVPCSPKSLARRVTSIKAFFRWLFKNGRIPSDPAEKVLQQSVLSPLPVILTMEEQELALKTAEAQARTGKPDLRAYALLMLLLHTGLKKGEILGLRVNHINTDSTTEPFLYVRYTQPKNRYKERKIMLTPEWIALYQEYKEQNQILDQVFPWSPRRLEYLLEEISQKSGLEKHISFDMCRWTCSLNDWNAGMDHDMLRQKLGISKIQWREVSHKLRQLAGQSSSTE